MLACLIGYLGDFDLAEEAAAEAFAIAAQRWPGTGMPDNPGAWLVTTAATGPSTGCAATACWPPSSPCSPSRDRENPGRTS